MIPPFDYKIPKTLEEACQFLWELNGRAKMIAGGTDLVIALRNETMRPQVLIDISKIPELRSIEEMGGMISIGASVTHSEIASTSLIKRYVNVLSAATSEIGSPQIRNLGTIGGNIVNASPAADTLPPLMVLNAVGTVVSKEEKKEVPVAQLFKGPYETSLKPHEILIKMTFPKLSSEMKTSFVRLARREAMAIARVNVAIVLQVRNDLIQEIRVSLGSITPTPQRMTDAEAVLKGKKIEEELVRRASKKISEVMVHWSGVRPSTSYKAPVVESLFLRAFRKALET